MAKDVITRFKLETTAFDSAIKRASKELSDYSKTATQAKEGFNQFTKSSVEAARALGTIATSSTNAKLKAQELVGAFNETAKAYNALTKEQQQSDFGKAMAASLTTLQQRIREVKSEMQGLDDSVKSVGGLFGGKLDGMMSVLGGNLMTKGVMMAASFASEIGSCVQQGIELAKQGEGIRMAFERLGRADILDGLREATHGTVTDIELMKAAVKFNDFRLPLDELATMLAFAQQKAKDTGQSVDYMVDSIVTGLGRQSVMILDNLGLSASQIKERMKETGDMTSAVGQIIREQMQNAGEYVETAADRAAQATVSLQNKMEELGRKFAPVEEASNQLWTSMKIGILDIIGGPLTTLLNKLTEAGRIRLQFEGIGGSDRVNKFLGNLQGAKDGNRNDLYKRQIANYDKAISERQFYIDNYKLRAKGTKLLTPEDSAALKRMEQFELRTGIKAPAAARESIAALELSKSQYVSGAQAILSPTTPTTLTTSTTRTPRVGGGSTSVVKSEEQLNSEKINALTQEYVNATKERQTAIQSEIKGLQERNAEIQRLKDEAQGKIELFEPGTMKYYQNELKTLQDELLRMREKGEDPIAIEFKQDEIKTVQKEIDRLNGKVEVEVEVKVPPMSLEEQIRTELAASIEKADYSMMGNLMKAQIKYGLESVDFTPLQEALVEGMNIPDETWQAIIDKFNEQLRDKGITLTGDFDSGSLKEGSVSKENPITKLTGDLNKFSAGLGSLENGLTKLGIELPKEFNSLIGVLQGVSSVITGVQSVIQIFSTSSQTANTISLNALTAAVLANTAAINVNSAFSLIPFKNGGIVPHAASGYLVPGNDFSDKTPVLVSSGELILNKAQQGAIAEQLQGGGGFGGELTARVTAEDIIFVLNNNGLRRGYGKFIND